MATLGVADSKAAIDSGTITGITNLTTTSAGTMGFYGVTTAVRRPYSSAVHASSAASVSASFGATQLAILQELQTTLIGLGIWATV